MKVDYDLVIIGGSIIGRYAAAFAAYHQARVALIEPEVPNVNCPETKTIYNSVVRQAAEVNQTIHTANQFGIYLPSATKLNDISIKFNDIMQFAAEVVTNLEIENSLTTLAALGVDVIVGKGNFYRLPHLGFLVNNRQVRSRAYLIATDYLPVIPEIEGLETTGYLTSQNFITNAINSQNISLQIQAFINKNHLKSLVILGNSAAAIQLAQSFTRLGCQVTLVVKNSQILPKEDVETSNFIQAILEAEGVRILTKTQVSQTKRIDNKKWIQAGDEAIEADNIILAIGEIPNIASLNLPAVGVKINQSGIEINSKLQTTNPRIYSITGSSYKFTPVSYYEATIAVKNALFIPWNKVNYQIIPKAIFSDPVLIRIGLNETEAKKRYGQDVLVLRKSFKTVAKAQIVGQTTGFCQILVRRNGEILGSCIIGVNAEELIKPIALAMANNLKIDALANSPYIWPSLSEIVSQTATEWYRQRSLLPTMRQSLIEWFFSLRRSWLF